MTRPTVRTGPGVRTVVRLDSRIALEAILLNRYECIPKNRREEWLRSLLVQGFLLECRAVRSMRDEPSRSRKEEFGNWLAGQNEPQVKAAPTCESPAARQGKKPFAALHQVIAPLQRDQ